MFETQEVLLKLTINEFKSDEDMIRGTNLFRTVRNDEERRSLLVMCLTLQQLTEEFGDKEFYNKLSLILSKNEINYDIFLNWYSSDRIKRILSSKQSWKIDNDVKNIRDNKKYHFWFNSGTLKLSTIHSFKGWETNTLILIIEPRYEHGDFQVSFDELVYVGLTRSRSNLIVLNYGNEEYHKKLEDLFLIKPE